MGYGRKLKKIVSPEKNATNFLKFKDTKNVILLV